MSPLPRYRRTLTGNCRPRRGLFGRVVMQVQVRVESLDPFLAGADPARERARSTQPRERAVLATWHEWRDARLDDFVLATAAPLLSLKGGA